MLPPPLNSLCCCCCEEPEEKPPPGEIWGTTPPPWDWPDWPDFEPALRRYSKDTGRSCGHFFRTLATGKTADSYLAGRQTLLTKIKNLNQLQKRFGGPSVCARIPTPAPTTTPPRFVAPPVAIAPYNLRTTGNPLQPRPEYDSQSLGDTQRAAARWMKLDRITTYIEDGTGKVIWESQRGSSRRGY